MPRRLTARLCAIAVIGAVAVSASGCVTEPETGATPTATAASTDAPTPSATVETTPESTADAVLPETCEDVYSADMLSLLQQEIPPMNDPAVTMLSTQDVDGLDLLDSGIPTLRCSWGPPSDSGMSTNVSVVDDSEAASLQDSLRQAGFTCDDGPVGTICTIEERGVDLDDVEYVLGEVHVFPDGGWVATRWINHLPEGYTEDIIATVWG